MYFVDFESFARAKEGAKSFIIEVMRSDGVTVRSSAFPMEAYAQALADIATVEELKTMMTLWDREGNQLGMVIFIPYDQIRSISILFGPSK